MWGKKGFFFLMVILICSGIVFATPRFTKIEDFDGAIMGSLVGSIDDQQIAQHFPNAKILYFATMPDETQALQVNKIDAFLTDLPLAINISNTIPEVSFFQQPLAKDNYGFVFAKNEKGSALRDQMNAFLTKVRSDGTLDKIDKLWSGTDKQAKKLDDLSSLPMTNGVIKYACNSVNEPFCYVADGKVIG